MVETIASLVSRAEAQFSYLLNNDLSPDTGLLVFKFPKARPTLEDEQANLKAWAKVHEIHDTNSLSLECQLRNNSKFRDFIRQLLKSLLDILERIRKAFKDLRSASDLMVDDDPDISADIEVFVERIPDIVNCLMRLNDTIKDPGEMDRYLSYHTDTSAFEALATQHVVDKFEGIQAYLARRLGKAISRRRQHIEYRKAHQERLLQCVDG
ncbi:Transcription factor RfeG [Colletotrichum scovillei]|uniref:Transcription factor RfeG n=1 Tax=Colletotrichum scovillei TaxID=1209932 RepID=A0A9P7UFG1_9PEZI|nr:Transcription factor RfeG [Colletotrichum scovillei]KAG7072142.1 Transcription factor RfeG [Colletotrichum scovillei]KAG7080421.1 Transcription factor RfeG [Colletotrichum scovillei]